jgi:hypothetical protein
MFARTAPDGSVTVPLMRPFTSTAKAIWGLAMRKHAISSRRREVLRSSIFMEFASFSDDVEQGYLSHWPKSCSVAALLQYRRASQALKLTRRGHPCLWKFQGVFFYKGVFEILECNSEANSKMADSSQFCPAQKPKFIEF